MDNPIKNQVQADTVERYIVYLRLKVMHDDTPLDDRRAARVEMYTLKKDLLHYNENTKIRLVVDNS